MRNKYDFSKGEQGKFYVPENEINIPIYLDSEIKEYYEEKAKEAKEDIEVLVNSILKKEMKSSETFN